MMMLDLIETGRVPVQTCPLFLFVAPRAVSLYKTSFSSLDHQLETETSLQSSQSSSGGFVCYKETKVVTLADVSECLSQSDHEGLRLSPLRCLHQPGSQIGNQAFQETDSR